MASRALLSSRNQIRTLLISSNALDRTVLLSVYANHFPLLYVAEGLRSDHRTDLPQLPSPTLPFSVLRPLHPIVYFVLISRMSLSWGFAPIAARSQSKHPTFKPYQTFRRACTDQRLPAAPSKRIPFKERRSSVRWISFPGSISSAAGNIEASYPLVDVLESVHLIKGSVVLHESFPTIPFCVSVTLTHSLAAPGRWYPVAFRMTYKRC